MDNRKFCVIITKSNGEKEVAVRATRVGIKRYIAVSHTTHSDYKYVVFHIFNNMGDIIELVAESIDEPTYYLRVRDDISYHSEEKEEIPFGSKLYKEFMEQYTQC